MQSFPILKAIFPFCFLKLFFFFKIPFKRLGHIPRAFTDDYYFFNFLVAVKKKKKKKKKEERKKPSGILL